MKKLRLFSRHSIFAMEFQAPNRTTIALSGAWWAHFETFLHEAPPRWRLKGEKKNSNFIRCPYKEKSRKNKSYQAGREPNRSTPSDLVYLSKKTPSIIWVQISSFPQRIKKGKDSQKSISQRFICPHTCGIIAGIRNPA